MDAPPEPTLPELCPARYLDDSSGDAMQFAVRVPNGPIVAAFLSEGLAREFHCWLSQQTLDRAPETLRALRTMTEPGPVLRFGPLARS